ncbi:CDP-diacylglycerol/glycerol-3-phosphate3-phospha tidyltransferase OS=Tsukamurella paurometabola (strain ATCC 8368 / DSM / CCUG 35730 / CIP 100753 / JCM 10117 / KCTC 9821 / NBRC 16120 / NCIMB 702349 / NCTC 13040)OX=521096 GN=Tpau_1775 PE=3 SV=1 [Tsukamurella paurometabola]|uniref:CDP-diacylglycerol--glycerol-3-phosphate 3-phosphatidyltransferase n=1 Tax=Tsukamurella paurometabola (strain ATCC 8368 / DSM 20162 / CCUG 35730 / CIP 100753 / JCM 10117 / KCTC 9821 / NBRC 16120 / NCIMB 702349 / NCTC 13040) TaxID=521096 RepID=D5UMB3_TSUPD|nr:CDP-diacylglycerol/glycerol-3-phosphate3-phospha tidyltransferase [Tsukamurella paurometabola DSM 20162]SUP31468.1 Putative CDP-diacylglycerol--glycerol-3-phosphate 3-phosphatidyl-transferase 2 [Tsukamurella paurometabola]
MSAPDGVSPTDTRVPNVNVANALTVLRMLLVPVFLVTLFAAGGHDPMWRWIAFAVFAVAMFTDRADGQIARRYGLITDFGKLMDPIADKALTGAAFIGLSALGDLPWWVTVVILGRELGITALRFWVISDGVIPASRGGKLKTLLQTLAIGLYLMPLPEVMHWPKVAVMAAAVVVTVVTGFDYVRSVRRASDTVA